MVAKFLTGSEIIQAVGKSLYPDFDLSEPERRKIYEQVFYLFTDNRKMVDFGLVPGKGLLLIGNIGVGKTMMMKTMQVVLRESPRRFRWVNCLEFKDMLEDQMKPSEIKEMYGRGLKCDLYIDDLGLGRSDFNRFGNVTNIISEILFERDELFVSDGYRTHLSSNVPTTVKSDAPPEVKSLERMYGDRILDRMKQMCNQIIWTGKSLRK